MVELVARGILRLEGLKFDVSERRHRGRRFPSAIPTALGFE
jgi:hypothetical protein